MFDSALERFTQLQPDPGDIARAMSAAGLVVNRQRHGYGLTIPTARWLGMVRDRFMSLLSTYSDAELATGLAEIEQRMGGADHVAFQDTFEFVCGRWEE
ncbi:MAG: hypothetical protein LBK95_11095 [Bifidobacteriaceae bacterium]|nr:hypothetical protein [Bifidobacteriaceae bacterium]